MERAASLDHQINIYQEQLAQDQKNFLQVTANHQTLTQKKNHLLEKIDALANKKRDFELKEKQNFETIQKEIQSLNQIKEKLQKKSFQSEKLARLKKDLNELEIEGKDLNQKLELISNKLQTLDLEEIEKQKAHFNSLFEASVDFEKQKENLAKKQKQIQDKQALLSQKIVEEKEKEASIRQKIDKFSRELKLRQDSLELQELKKSIHLCSVKSQEDNICVVCHQSLDGAKLDFKISQDDLSVQSLLDEIQIFQKDISRFEKEEIQSRTLLERTHTEKEELNKEFSELEKKFKEDFKDFLKEKTNKEKIKAELQALETKKQIFSELSLENKNFSQELIQLRNKYKKLSLEREELEKESALDEKTIQELIARLEISKIEEASFDSISHILKKIQILSEDILQLQNLKQESSALIVRIDEASSRLEDLQKNLERTKNQIALTKNKRDEITTISAPHELAQKYTQAFKQIEKSYQEASQTQTSFDIELHELEAKKRQTLEQIESITLMLEFHLSGLKENLIIEKSDELPPHFAYDLFEKFTEDLNPKLLDKLILEAIKQQVDTFISECHTKIEEIQNELSKVETLLAEYHKTSKRKELIELEMSRLFESKKRKEHLYQLVGRDEFRNFVLSQIEKELIEQTNRELKELCGGRYEIIQENRANRIQPEFFIIDKLRDGQTRKVSTLSGGETFMVSLATALALAELSRGNAEIDSFFIDEGFGSLDEESLEDVIEMLQNIQGMGKQIGVISHVKKLTSRIPINLYLEKNQFGNSKISLAFN